MHNTIDAYAKCVLTPSIEGQSRPTTSDNMNNSTSSESRALPVAAHSPTPWRVEEMTGNQVAVLADNPVRVVATLQITQTALTRNEYRMENAALIVRAVNSHADLCAALQTAAHQLDFIVSSLHAGHTVSVSSVQNCAAAAWIALAAATKD